MKRPKVKIKAKALLMILTRRNMSQNSLGRFINLQSGHVSQLISGKRHVSPDARSKILAALPGVEFDDIFSIRHA